MFKLNTPNLGPLNRPLRTLRHILPPLNFITVHYIYFLATSLLSAVIFWGASTPPRSISFTDSLFLTVSAMTEAGLNTVNLSKLNTFQQFMLFALIMAGSAIWVSAFVVQVRKTAFERKFKDVIELQRQRRQRERARSSSRRRFSFSRRGTQGLQDEGEGNAEFEESNGSSQNDRDKAGNESNAVGVDLERMSTPPARRGAPEMNGISSATGERDESAMVSDDDLSTAAQPGRTNGAGISFAGDTRFSAASPTTYGQPVRRHRSSFLSMQGVGARPLASLRPTTNLPPMSHAESQCPPQGHKIKYFKSLNGWVARNSQFHGLSEAEREKLGGYEYRAIQFLAWIVPLYFVLWQLLGCLALAAYVARNHPDLARANGLNPWWVGAFNAVSAFNNSGMSLLDANMTAFASSYYMLLSMSVLILAGNTCYPIFLRLIVWTLLQICPHDAQWREQRVTLHFLLDHPRRCYTNLFPSPHTWWLLFAVVSLNGVDWAAYEILNIGNAALANPTHIRVIDGLFQAFAVRSGGFYVVAIPTLRISLQLLYVVMMYISVYPVVITMRNSNVYEERSLGIYAEDAPAQPEEPPSSDNNSSSGAKQQPSSAGLPGMLRRARSIRAHFTSRGGGGGGGGGTEHANKHFVRQQLRAQLAHDAWWIVLALFLIMIAENGRFGADPLHYSVFNFMFEVVSAYGCVGISVGVPWAAYSFCGGWGTVAKLVLCAVMLRGRHRGLPVAIDRAVLLPGEAVGMAEEEDRRIRWERSASRGRGEV